MRLVNVAFVAIIIVTLFMVYDSMAETTTIIMPDGSILTCSTDSTGIVVCV
jgi:hypothetical protein